MDNKKKINDPKIDKNQEIRTNEERTQIGNRQYFGHHSLQESHLVQESVSDEPNNKVILSREVS
jgi:hypothetical protein